MLLYTTQHPNTPQQNLQQHIFYIAQPIMYKPFKVYIKICNTSSTEQKLNTFANETKRINAENKNKVE